MQRFFSDLSMKEEFCSECLGKNFIVHSILCISSKSGFGEELYFQTSYCGYTKIKDLCPVQGRTLLFVNSIVSEKLSYSLKKLLEAIPKPF